MLGYLYNILIPYVNAMWDELKLRMTHSYLVIFDTFKGQTTPNFLKVLEQNNILVAEIPINCTDQLQPVNKPLKDQMKRVSPMVSEEVEKRINSSATDAERLVDLKLSRLKPLGLKWLVEACSYVETNDGFLSLA